MIEIKRLNDHGYAKNSLYMAMRLQVLPQNIPLLWQLINHKYIVSVPELLTWHTINIIMANFNKMQTHICRL